MDTPNATSVAQLARQLGLVTDEQLREIWDDLDTAEHTAENVLRALERKGYLTPWQSSKLIKGDRDGYVMGGYKILYRVSSGSFGRVFRAEDMRDGSIVAIKVLRRRWSEEPKKVDLFEREGRLGMSMHHANIVRILAVNKDKASGQYYIVMEFVEGGNLRDFLKVREKLEFKEALRLLEECSSALAYANMRGLTHRDLKPTNVLISTLGSAKLVDFGLAEIAAPLPGEDHDLTVDRTVDYAGLEKATAVKHGDPRSDIYFLGTIFYEMITGHPALSQTRDKVARMNRHRFDNVAPVESWGIEPPGPVQLLLRKMLSFDPAGRYQTPAQLHEAVRKAQGELDGIVSHKMAPAGPKSLFVVEANEKLKEVFRDRFTAEKFRVLMSSTPDRALHRYEEQPYHAIVVDAGTAGEPGLRAFKKLFEEADEIDLSLAGVLILNEDQAEWADQIPKRPDACVLIRPINFKQLADKLRDVLERAGDEVPA